MADERRSIFTLSLECVGKGEDRKAAMLYGFAKGLEYVDFVSKAPPLVYTQVEDEASVDPASRWSLRARKS